MLYITFNDHPSGIYFSQVTDVCKFIHHELGVDVQLLAFISIRKFAVNKKAIRSAFPNAIVIPMFPGVKNWKRNLLSLSLRSSLLKNRDVIARGPFAAWLALQLKKNGKIKTVCFDARGAYTAEFHEYNVSGEASLNASIRELEQEVLEHSDKQIAVSNALIDHWKKEFNFQKQTFQVIPCTMDSSYEADLSIERMNMKRLELGIGSDEILIVYSGSGAAWQSLDMAMKFLEHLLNSNYKIKLLLLVPAIKELDRLEKYKNRIIHKWVAPAEVRDLLIACDYGLLIREESVTNAVSSPVKFAEYLACGLKIIISENIGDYSAFVKEQQLGICLTENEVPVLARPDKKEKMRIADIAKKYFSKKAFVGSYKKIVGLNRI